jgi:hypothetical protein
MDHALEELCERGRAVRGARALGQTDSKKKPPGKRLALSTTSLGPWGNRTNGHTCGRTTQWGRKRDA